MEYATSFVRVVREVLGTSRASFLSVTLGARTAFGLRDRAFAPCNVRPQSRPTLGQSLPKRAPKGASKGCLRLGCHLGVGSGTHVGHLKKASGPCPSGFIKKGRHAHWHCTHILLPECSLIARRACPLPHTHVVPLNHLSPKNA